MNTPEAMAPMSFKSQGEDLGTYTRVARVVAPCTCQMPKLVLTYGMLRFVQFTGADERPRARAQS